MRTGGAGARAMTRAFEDLFAIADAFRGIPMAGRTDAWILSEAAAAHGIPAGSSGLARFPQLYAQHLERELPHPGPRKGLMPGVREDLRGTYAGLASEPAVAYLRDLGVTAVELLPVHHIAD